VLKFVPGGSAILGFLVAGAAIGPYGLGLIVDTEPVKHLAEIGVIFLLFNLGLELSLERLIALARQVRSALGCQSIRWLSNAGLQTPVVIHWCCSRWIVHSQQLPVTCASQSELQSMTL
jgi:predicted Kef-type K+ transport protein